jgi:hypothetical protein
MADDDGSDGSVAEYEYVTDGDADVDDEATAAPVGSRPTNSASMFLSQLAREAEELARVFEGAAAGHAVLGVGKVAVHVGASLRRLTIVTPQDALALGFPSWDPEALVVFRVVLDGLHTAADWSQVLVSVDGPEHMFLLPGSVSLHGHSSFNREPGAVPLSMRATLCRRMADRLRVSWGVPPLAPRGALTVAPGFLVKQVQAMCGGTAEAASAALAAAEWDIHDAVGRLGLRAGGGHAGGDAGCGGGGGGVVGFAGPAPGARPSWLQRPHVVLPLRIEDLPPWELQVMQWSITARLLVAWETEVRACSRTCLLCDAPLAMVTPKPSVCGEPFCRTRHCLYGVGTDVVGQLQANRAVAELLISQLYAAAQHPKRIMLCFPREVVSRDATAAFVTGGVEDVALLQRVVDLVPPVDVMLELARDTRQCASGQPRDAVLQAALEAIHPLLYPLLRWMFSTCQAVVRLLPEEDALPQLRDTYHQFLVQCGPTDTTTAFLRLQAAHGSVWAFHGSGPQNWLSVMFQGLRSMSNTPYMSAGAAYGAGMYFADALSVSLGYCGYPGLKLWPHSPYGPATVALCEVAPVDPGWCKPGLGTTLHVVPDAHAVAVRLLLVQRKKTAATAPKAAADATHCASALLPATPPAT